MSKLIKTIHIFGGIFGGLFICTVTEIILGNFVGKGISFLFFPINFILAKGIFEEGSQTSDNTSEVQK